VKKILFLCTFLCCNFALYSQDLFQLAPPILQYESSFFEKKAMVTIKFAQKNTQIHYTTNGKTPTKNDPIYTRPVVVKNHLTTVKAKVFGEGYLPSEAVEVCFYKQGVAITKVEHTKPHKNYLGSGERTLIDQKGGDMGHSNPTWMGFLQDTLMFTLDLAKPQKVKSLMAHVLISQPTWIFLPEKIEVYFPDPITGTLKLMATKALDATTKVPENATQAVVLDLDNHLKTKRVVVKIYTLTHIPEWHDGKGTLGWFFIDELMVY
jgi:Chitobiase/beta-hexosaminidase C-terminal domain